MNPDSPRTQPDAEGSKPFLPRWVLLLALPGTLAPLFILAFIVINGTLHDPARCPFRERTRQELAPDLYVIDEARNCVGSAEEHRYSLVRDGRARVLGERSFDRREFTPDRYSWQAQLSAQGEVQVSVHIAGRGDLSFREGTTAEHEKEAKALSGH